LAGVWGDNVSISFRAYPYLFMDIFHAVFRIRIHQIHMFLGLPDSDPDPLVRDMDPDPDPSIIMQK
jgi:hypothetical protein